MPNTYHSIRFSLCHAQLIYAPIFTRIASFPSQIPRLYLQVNVSAFQAQTPMI